LTRLRTDYLLSLSPISCTTHAFGICGFPELYWFVTCSVYNDLSFNDDHVPTVVNVVCRIFAAKHVPQHF